jgi:hypothetical protein
MNATVNGPMNATVNGSMNATVDDLRAGLRSTCADGQRAWDAAWAARQHQVLERALHVHGRRRVRRERLRATGAAISMAMVILGVARLAGGGSTSASELRTELGGPVAVELAGRGPSVGAATMASDDAGYLD